MPGQLDTEYMMSEQLDTEYLTAEKLDTEYMMPEQPDTEYLTPGYLDAEYLRPTGQPYTLHLTSGQLITARGTRETKQFTLGARTSGCTCNTKLGTRATVLLTLGFKTTERLPRNLTNQTLNA